MQWDRRGFLGASIVTAAYPFARAIAKPPSKNTDLILSFEDAGGSTLNSGAKNNRAYTKAITYLSRRGGGTLAVPPKVYPFDGDSSCVATNVTVLADGATFVGDNCRITLGQGSTGYNIYGLTLIETSGDLRSFLINCYASGCHFKDVHLQKNPPCGGYIAYCQENTAGNLFENVSFSGSNGIFLGGHDHEIRGGWAESFGNDDCWVLKASRAPCYNIRISGFTARGFAALFSIGSEIGTAQADDPSYSLFVRNVSVENCTAQQCTRLAYIKPGGGAADYRDGLVEDVSITSCSIEDLEGTTFYSGICITPGRGAIVRRINFDDIRVRARGRYPAHDVVAGILLRPEPTTDGAGRGGMIDGITINRMVCEDPFGGVNTSSSAPGTAIQNFLAAEKANPSIGTIGQVVIADSQLDGCARAAVGIGGQVKGPIALNGCTLANFAASVAASYDQGSVFAGSPVSLTNLVAIPAPSAPTGTRGVMSDAKPDKTIPYFGDQARTALPSLAPGGSASSVLFTSVRDTWISEVEVAISQPIPASSTDFVRFTLRNAASGAVLGSATTSTGLLAQPGTPASLNGAVKFSGAAASIPKGAQLLVEISQAGSGAAVADPTFTVHCVPFGIA
jgi:hypothetical protein